MESHEISLAAFTHETVPLSAPGLSRPRNLDTLRQDIRLVARFGGEDNVISRCTFTIFQRELQLEHVDVATEVKKSIAADRNTTYALRNDEYPTYAIFKQSKLKIAISYRSTRQQMRQIQFEFLREQEFRNILKILEMLRCPLRESLNQTSSVMSSRPVSQMQSQQLDGARRQRTAIAPKPTPAPTSRPPSRWFTAEERRPATSVRPRTDLPARVPDWDTPVTARFNNLPDNLPPRRELPFSRSTTPQGFQPSTPQGVKRKSEALVKDSQPQKVAQSPYFKRPALSQSQGDSQNAILDSQLERTLDTQLSQPADRSTLPEAQVPFPPTQANGEASLSSEPSMQAPTTSDSILNGKTIATSATTVNGATIKDLFNGVSSDADSRDALRPFLEMSEEQQTIYLDDLVVRLTEDEGFIRVAECMQKCWKRIGLDPA